MQWACWQQLIQACSQDWQETWVQDNCAGGRLFKEIKQSPLPASPRPPYSKLPRNLLLSLTSASLVPEGAAHSRHSAGPGEHQKHTVLLCSGSLVAISLSCISGHRVL